MNRSVMEPSRIRRGRSVGLRLVATGLLGVVLGGGLGACSGRDPGSRSLVTRAGNFTLELVLEPDPPREKGNTLWVAVKDPQGNPVEGAGLDLRFTMPAMGSMPEMRARGEISERGQGRYRARFDLPMKGTWTMEVEVEAPGGSALASYSLTVGSRGLRELQASGSGRVRESGEAPEFAWQIPKMELPAHLLQTLEKALVEYEGIREALAADRLEGVASQAEALAGLLEKAEEAQTRDPSPVTPLVAEGAGAAQGLARARDLAEAREAFGEVSRFLIALAAADPRLAGGRQVFACPMKEGFNKWIQVSGEIENPYMGLGMLACGDASDWTVPPPLTPQELEAHGRHVHDSDEIAHYTCSMHPSVKQKEPGTCPICSMDLVPVTRGEIETGTILLDAERRQEIGVRTAPVARRPLTVEIRAVGRVAYDETRLADVSVKYRGWIGQLQVDRPGQWVKKGQILFTLYSPELYAAQEEFLTALESQQAARETSVPDRADYLVASARERLRLWDLQDWQIDEIARGGRPLQYVPIVSPVSGYVIEKYVVEGAAVEPGMKLYRIAGLDRVWIEAEVYEYELPLVQVGQPVTVTLPYIPGRQLPGRVAFVYPYLEGASRTGRVRVEVANPGLELKPDMYANVEFEADLGERLVVPEEAVLYAGARRFVFLDLGEGRLRPHEIQVGVRAGDFLEVLSGLEPGDVVVTSGNFLIAAESRLKLAMEHWK